MTRKRHKEPERVRLLCLSCHVWFDMDKTTYEIVSDPHVCIDCVRRESEETRKRLLSRGIVL